MTELFVMILSKRDADYIDTFSLLILENPQKIWVIL